MANRTHYNGHGTGVGNETLILFPNLCTLETCDLSLSSFDYLPSLGGNAFFAAIFGVLLIAQLYLGIRYRIWGYMSAMLLGLLTEALGYVARVLENQSPFNNDWFTMYLCCLTIAPALLSASIYLCLARIINVYGDSLSRFRPRTYTIVFCTCDFICLVLQGAGGGIASTANTRSGVNVGKNMMLAGLIFQVLSLALFAIACAEFAWSVKGSKGLRNQKHGAVTSSKLFKAFLIGLIISTIAIFARSIYRCAELAGGFDGRLFRSDEAVFMVLEATMITIASLYLTILHPGICFQGAWHEVNFSFRQKKSASYEENGSAERMSDGSRMEFVNMSETTPGRK